MKPALERFKDLQRAQRDQVAPASAVTLSKMTIREFATSGRTLRIQSEVLGCDVILAADNADVSVTGSSGLPVFRAREFKHLRDVNPEQLRLIHAAKVEFAGELVD
jgi:hypothetical protein